MHSQGFFMHSLHYVGLHNSFVSNCSLHIILDYILHVHNSCQVGYWFALLRNDLLGLCVKRDVKLYHSLTLLFCPPSMG